MRVRRFSLIRLRDEERGAVAAIVAICMICLIGMLVLTFDLGHGVALKRNMVNGADAAALAAARECGLAHGEAKAKQAAADLLVDNNEAATLLPGADGFEINPSPAQCSGAPNPNPDADPNTVTVTATVPVEYFFAPIFGFNNGTVVATATATWEAGVGNPVPLKLDLLKVQDCTKDEAGNWRAEGYSGPECFFEFEKEKTGPQRGWLDFPGGWPVQGQDPNPKTCTSQAGGVNELREYIRQMGMEVPTSSFAPALWVPPPTYVCAAGGVPNELVTAIIAWLNAVAAKPPPAPVIFFPVVACEGATAPCYPWIRTSGHEAYPVVTFIGMRVEHAWAGQDARKQKNCEFTRKGSDVFCIQLSVAPLDQSEPNTAVIVRLVD
jgi:Flp pilus assembly protein TadG